MQASSRPFETGGERPHKIGLEFDPFRTTRAKSPHIRLPPVAQVSFFRMPEARMSLFRVAALLIMCGIALSATPQNSATTPAAKPDDIPKSIAEQVQLESGTKVEFETNGRELTVRPQRPVRSRRRKVKLAEGKNGIGTIREVQRLLRSCHRLRYALGCVSLAMAVRSYSVGLKR